MSNGDDSEELVAPLTEYVTPGPDVTDTAPALVPDLKARIQLMNDHQ